MQVYKLPLTDIPQFSKRDLAYIREVEALHPFYKYPVNLGAFEQVIADKQQIPVDRALLVDALKTQYERFPVSEKVNANIDLLAQATTFTITTAHQPSLFTGPLYYIYKILSTIRLAEVLREQYSAYSFVPVFVSGAEDHDFEEVNHAQIFGKTIRWESAELGAVGQMQTGKLAEPLAELEALLGESEHAQAIFKTIQRAYTQHKHYGVATLSLVHELFKEFGLVVLDMNIAALKKAMIPIFESELKEQVSAPFIEAQTSALEAIGYAAQASPRSINLFYLRDQLRGRIVSEEGRYQVLNSNFSFSETEIIEELHAHPERFSPNVVLRPIYQELILPNLAYIGGGGEIAYWLERKTQFEHFGINFPMLIRRSSGLIINKGASKKMAKLELSIYDLLEDEDQLVKAFINKNTDNELSLNEQKKAIESIFEDIQHLAVAIDPTLKNSVLAEQSKQIKGLEALEAKFVKAEKRKNEVRLNQLKNLKEQLFPGRSLQERQVNFLSFYTQYGSGFFELIKKHLNPLEKCFVVFVED